MSDQVSVIVLNMNGGEMILECLRSIRSQEPPPDRIVVVDNGSADGSDDLVEEAFGDVILLRQGENTGFARGNNIGLRSAEGDLVVLVNNDCVAEEGWLASLWATAGSDHSIGAVASSMRNIRDRNVLDSAGGALDWLGFAWDRGWGLPASELPERDGVPFACAGAAMLRRSALPDPDRLFDDDLFIYGEDVELGLQLNRNGWKVVYDPGAVIRHVHSATTVSGSYFKEFLCARNRLIVLRRQFRPEVFRKLRPAILGWQAIWSASLLGRGNLTHFRAVVDGTREGLRTAVTYQETGVPVEDVFRRFAVRRRPWPFFQDAARRAMGC